MTFPGPSLSVNTMYWLQIPSFTVEEKDGGPVDPGQPGYKNFAPNWGGCPRINNGSPGFTICPANKLEKKHSHQAHMIEIQCENPLQETSQNIRRSEERSIGNLDRRRMVSRWSCVSRDVESVLTKRIFLERGRPHSTPCGKSRQLVQRDKSQGDKLH